MVAPIIRFDQYNKIVDDVYLLGHNAILKMNVQLNYNTDNYGKVPYHKEFEYFDQSSGSNMITMRRTFDYYLSIENLRPPDSGQKEFIRIGQPEIMLIRGGLSSAVRWFTEVEFANLYVKKKEKLILARKVDPIEMNQLPMGKYIVLEPTILEYNDIQSPGVKMYLSSVTNYVEMNLSRFMGFVQLMNDINIFMSAQNMLSYFGRPEFGSNMYSFKNQNATSEPEEKVTAKPGRQIQAGKQQSYFDQFRDL